MDPKSVLKVFLDTSAIFAAILSPSGGARKLFYLSAAGLIELAVSRDVLRECEEVVRRKSPASLPWLARLLELGEVIITPAPTPYQIRKAGTYVRYPPDARILAGAFRAMPDWFITHDREHFLKIPAEKELPFRVGTPGDCIQSLRDAYKIG